MTDTVVPTHLHPTLATIGDHLLAEHLTTGITAESVAGATPAELLAWHDADHRLVRTLYLGHDHGDVATAAAPPAADHDAKVHAATLKAIAEGRPVANVDEMVAWAASVEARLAADNTAPGGQRRAGAGVVSPYDRRCLEVAAAVAERALRTNKRRGRAA